MSKPYFSVHLKRIGPSWYFDLRRNGRLFMRSDRRRSRRGAVHAADSLRWGVDHWYDEHGRLARERIGDHEDHARAKEAAGR